MYVFNLIACDHLSHKQEPVSQEQGKQKYFQPEHMCKTKLIYT